MSAGIAAALARPTSTASHSARGQQSLLHHVTHPLWRTPDPACGCVRCCPAHSGDSDEGRAPLPAARRLTTATDARAAADGGDSGFTLIDTAMPGDDDMQEIFAGNRKWAEESDPAVFAATARAQKPRFLWIGCSDRWSRCGGVSRRARYVATTVDAVLVCRSKTAVPRAPPPAA